MLWVLFCLSNTFFLNQYRTKKDSAIFIFLTIWFVLNLVPVYKLFNISDDLQGSRLAYLATAPLCALFCFGFANLAKANNRIHYLTLFSLTAMLSAAGAALLINNSAWVKAETASQNILQELDRLSKEKNNDAVIYIVGLPDQINGAYVCRNALDGMTKYPQISKNIDHCFNLSEINQIFPFGYARQSMVNIASGTQPPQFYLWNAVEQKLKPFHLPILPDSQSQWKSSWAGADLKNIVSIPDQFKGLITFDQNGNLSVDTGKTKSNNGHPYITLNFAGRPCFDINCLVIETDWAYIPSIPSTFSLLYKNELSPDYQLSNQLNVSVLGKADGQKIIFPLHSQINWAMGGTCQGIQLLLPKGPFRITRLELEPINKYMPLLSFRASANQNALGYIELDKSHPSCQLTYDATAMPMANKLMLEFTSPNQTFASPNDFRPPQSSCLLKELPTLTGNISLNKLNFPKPGIYELRLRALDNNHQPVAVAGDHIVVTVK